MDDIFGHLARNIQKVQENLKNIVGQVVDENNERLSDLQVSQIQEGISPDGGHIGEYASDEYAEYKQSIGSKAPLGIVDLTLEGDFTEGVYVRYDEVFQGIESGSTDSKEEKLESWYGSENIFGFAPTSMPELIDIFSLETPNKIINEITKGI